MLCVSIISVVVKDNANERNENLFSHCRVQLILCKDERCLVCFCYMNDGRLRCGLWLFALQKVVNCVPKGDFLQCK